MDNVTASLIGDIVVAIVAVAIRSGGANDDIHNLAKKLFILSLLSERKPSLNKYSIWVDHRFTRRGPVNNELDAEKRRSS